MRKLTKALCIILCIASCFYITAFADGEFYDANGNLVYFESEYKGYENFTIPSVSKADAMEIASKYVTEKCPEVTKDISFEDATVTYSKYYPYGYNISFPRVINGIVYANDSISVFVDSKHGNIVSFSKNFSDNIVLEAASSIITPEAAEEKFISAYGMHLQYNKKISGNSISTYLTYTADDVIINAQTGNIIPVSYYIPTDGYFDVVNTAEKVSEYIDDSYSISISEANEIIRSIPELEVYDQYSIDSVNYLKNHDNTYLISLHYKSGNNYKEVTLNAKTGLLVEYVDNSADVNIKNYSKNAEAFTEKYYGEYLDEVIKRKSSDSVNTVLLYERLVNSIPYKSNGLYMCYKNGKLKMLSFAWDNVEFPNPENIVTPEYAYKQFFEKTGLELTYYRRENGVLTPVYRTSSRGTGIIDVYTGRQLNYDGSFFYAAKEMNYIDIDTHYAGYAASGLSDCDIYVSAGNVFLEDNITQQEFLLLISEFIDGTKPVLNTTGILTDDQREMLYAYMYENKILSRAETDYTGFVTRSDAVKYFMRILGHGEIGEMSDIFIQHFADSHLIPKEDTGYVELARSLGIINGSNNIFNPNAFITNGDSLIIMYNYLKTQG